MGCEAEKWVLAQFTQKKMGEGYLKVYQEVVAGEPLVSVIIAVHNGAEHLAAAIESVLAQDYSNVEILVMNNGSTDNTETVARRYPQVRYHELPVANLNWARNQGVEKALGAILAFLDHDDTWPKDKLRRQVNYLKTHPEVAGVIGLQQMYLDEDCPKPHWLKADFLKEPQTAHLPSALMVRREAFETMGCFDERYAFASDVAWFFKANDLGIKIDLMPEVLLYRRIHRANVSHKLQSLHHEYLQIIRDSVQMKRSGASL
ncbi:MAG: glycosyltransferase [Gammaproteobacteria bacterium]|nr:glycosyltransferase [Gammaproteobacteria bacterium]